MAREIKFKVWDGQKIFIPDILELVQADAQRSTAYVMRGKPVNKEFLASPLVVLQYTGLKDKNGREIYEGDVLSGKICMGRDMEDWTRWATKFVIEHDGTAFTIRAIEMDLNDKSTARPGWYEPESLSAEGIEKQDSMEVIGNVFENPELMEAHD